MSEPDIHNILEQLKCALLADKVYHLGTPTEDGPPTGQPAFVGGPTDDFLGMHFLGYKYVSPDEGA